MKTHDGYVVTTSVLHRMIEIISLLPIAQQKRCGDVVEVLNGLIQQLENESKAQRKKCCFEQLRRQPEVEA